MCEVHAHSGFLRIRWDGIGEGFNGLINWVTCNSVLSTNSAVINIQFLDNTKTSNTK